MSYWRLVSGPSSEPLTIAEAKQHLRVTVGTDDELIATQIAAARQIAEEFTGRALAPQTWELALDAFPASGVIVVPRPPLQSVTAIRYVDADGITRTMASADYFVDSRSEPARVVPAYGKSWPATREQPGSVMIEYIAGYGTLPAAMRSAMLLIVGELYERREESVIGTMPYRVPMSAEHILRPYRLLYPHDYAGR